MEVRVVCVCVLCCYTCVDNFEVEGHDLNKNCLLSLTSGRCVLCCLSSLDTFLVRDHVLRVIEFCMLS